MQIELVGTSVCRACQQRCDNDIMHEMQGNQILAVHSSVRFRSQHLALSIPRGAPMWFTCAPGGQSVAISLLAGSTGCLDGLGEYQ